MPSWSISFAKNIRCIDQAASEISNFGSGMCASSRDVCAAIVRRSDGVREARIRSARRTSVALRVSLSTAPARRRCAVRAARRAAIQRPLRVPSARICSAHLMAAALQRRLRLPMLRSAQLTAFFTKFRSSPASRRITGRNCRMSASGAVLSRYGEVRDHRERRALHVLAACAMTTACAFSYAYGVVDEEVADSHRRRPTSRSPSPSVHLALRHLRRLVDHAREDARFVDAGCPQLLVRAHGRARRASRSRASVGMLMPSVFVEAMP